MSTGRSPADPSPLKALLGSAASRFGLDDALSTGTLWKRWPEIVGDDVAAHAQPTSLRAGVLRIRADSPVWAHEIGYLAEEIRRKANAALGRDAVAEVKVWNAPAGDPAPPPARPLPPRRRDASREGTPDRSGTAASAADMDPREALDHAHRAWLEKRRKARERGH